MEATNKVNYDSCLKKAITIFNGRMGTDFSSDKLILTCFMTEDQKEIFEQFCSKYFPYRLNDRYQEEGYFDFKASSFIGMNNGGIDGILLRTDISYQPGELLHIFLHELAHIFCAHNELDGKNFFDEYCMDYAPTKEEDGIINAGSAVSVSYTHLDVYKRQRSFWAAAGSSRMLSRWTRALRSTVFGLTLLMASALIILQTPP